MIVVKSDECSLRWCQDIRIHVKKIRFTINWTPNTCNFLMQSCFSKLEPNFGTQLCNKKLRLVQLCFSSIFFPIRTDGPKKSWGSVFNPVFALDKDGPKIVMIDDVLRCVFCWCVER